QPPAQRPPPKGRTPRSPPRRQHPVASPAQPCGCSIPARPVSQSSRPTPEIHLSTPHSTISFRYLATYHRKAHPIATHHRRNSTSAAKNPKNTTETTPFSVKNAAFIRRRSRGETMLCSYTSSPATNPNPPHASPPH